MKKSAVISIFVFIFFLFLGIPFISGQEMVYDEKSDMVSSSFARQVADFHCRSFFGEKEFFDVEEYYDENDNVAIYVHIYREPGIIISKPELLAITRKASEKLHNAHAKMDEGIKNNDLKKETEGRNLRWEALRELNQKDKFYSIYVSASKTHMPVIEWRRGLPQSYLRRGDILKKLKATERQNIDSIRYYYLNPVNSFAKVETPRGEEKVFAISGELTELPEESLKQVRFRRRKETKPGVSDVSVEKPFLRKPGIDKAWEFFEQDKRVTAPADFSTIQQTAPTPVQLSDVPNFLQADFNTIVTGGASCIIMATSSLVGYFDNPTRTNGNYWNLVEHCSYDGEVRNRAYGGFNVHNESNGSYYLDETKKKSVEDFVHDIAESLDYDFAAGWTEQRDIQHRMSVFTNSAHYENDLNFSFNGTSGRSISNISEFYNTIKTEINASRPIILSTTQYEWSSGYVPVSGGFYPVRGGHGVVVVGYCDGYWANHPETVNHPISVYPNGDPGNYGEYWWDLADMQRENVSLISVTPGGDTGGEGNFPVVPGINCHLERSIYTQDDEFDSIEYHDTFEWDTIPGAIMYSVQVSPDLTFAEGSTWDVTVYKPEAAVGRFFHFCQNNTSYYWRVKYMNERYNWSDYSAAQSFIYWDRSMFKVEITDMGNGYIEVSGPQGRNFNYTISHNASWLQIGASGSISNGSQIPYQVTYEDNVPGCEKEDVIITITEDSAAPNWLQARQVIVPIFRFKGLLNKTPFLYLFHESNFGIITTPSWVRGALTTEGNIFNAYPDLWEEKGVEGRQINLESGTSTQREFHLLSNLVRVEDFPSDPAPKHYYRITSDSPWLTCSSPEGEVDFSTYGKEFDGGTTVDYWDAERQFTLTFNAVGLAPGVYQGELTIETSYDAQFTTMVISPPQKIKYTLVVEPADYCDDKIAPAWLDFEPTSIVASFSSSNDTLQRTFWFRKKSNYYSQCMSDFNINFNVVTENGGPNFITLSGATENIVIGAPHDKVISINNNNLRSGINRAWIEITGDLLGNSPQRIPVIIFVSGPPVIRFIEPAQEIYNVNQNVPVQVELTDDTGLASYTIQYDSLGTFNVPLASNPLMWTTNTRQIPGLAFRVERPRITVTVTDIDGNTTQQVREFRIDRGNALNINITAPSSGTNWALGSTQSITWNTAAAAAASDSMATTQSTSANVSINLYKDYTLVGTLFSDIENTGSVMWTLSTLEDGTAIESGSNYQLGIVSADGTAGGFMEGTFTIRAADATQYLTLVSPNGGEEWTMGENRDIIWSSTGITGNVNLVLMGIDGTMAGTIAEDVPAADGTYTWQVGQTTSGQISVTSDFFIVKVMTPAYEVLDESDNGFNIYDNSNFDLFTKVTSGPIANDNAGTTVTHNEDGSTYIYPHKFLDSSWSDYDGDGHLDLYVTCNSGTNRLYRNNGNGTFTSISGNIVNTGETQELAAWGDTNTDGFPDLLTSGMSGVSNLFVNNGDGTFTNSTSPLNGLYNWYDSVIWTDYDIDGDLDLFSSLDYEENKLFQNDGNGSFSSASAGPLTTDIDESYSSRAVHMDGDILPDILVNNYDDYSRAIIYKNNGDGSFSKNLGSDLFGAGHYTIYGWGDYDNDGDADCFAIEEDDDWNITFLVCRNNGDGSFTKLSNTGISIVEINEWVSEAKWGDFDNDGYMDLLLSKQETGNDLFHNNGDGTFTKITGSVVASESVDVRESMWVDYDNDGFLDILSINGQTNSLYRNNGNNNNWLQVICRGTQSNPIGLGAKVSINTTINGTVSQQLQWISAENNFRAHFGLGNSSSVAELRVEWPSGLVQVLKNVPVNRVLTVTEITSGLSITSPNGGETLQGGGVHTITWDYTENVENVKLEYSMDGGVNYVSIVDSIVNSGSYQWSVPDMASDNCLIRISEALPEGEEPSQLIDVSDAEFSISSNNLFASVTLNYPDGGEVFSSGTLVSVSWDYAGFLDNVKIEYSTDNGTTWIEITGSIANTGSFDWTVPDTPSDQCLVRVGDLDGIPADSSETVFSIASVPATCGITWNTVDMSMHNLTGTLWDIEYADSQFLLVGSSGYLYSSTDGFNWTQQSPGTTKNLMGITYGNSLYMAAGSTGTLITSPDGVTWTAQNLNTTYTLNDVAFGNGVFVVVGDAGYAFYSSDGVSWTTINTSAGAKLKRINYVNNLFVAVGEYGRIATSTDGTGWSNPTSGVGSIHLNGVAYGNSKYVAVGDGGTIITSPDAVTWSAETSGTSVRLHSVCFNEGQFIAVGDSGTLLTSPNGVDWSPQSSGTTDLLVTVVFVNSRYMAVGNSGRVIYSDCGIPASDPVITVTSPNGGESWEWDTQQTITWETSGGVVSNVKIEYSTDNGTNWTEIAASTPNDGSFAWTIPDTFSDTCLVRVGDIAGTPSDVSDAVFSIATPAITPILTVTAPNGGESFEAGSQQTITWSSEGYIENLKIEYSTDNGSNWTEIANTVSDSGSYDWITPDLSSTQCLVRVSDMDGDPADTGDAVFSIIPAPVDCGITWNTIDMSMHNLTGTLWDVVYADSQFLLVGSYGYLYSSTDGFNWTQQSPGTTKNLMGITYGNSLYMAAGSTGTLITSPDGVTWTAQNLNTTYTLNDVAFGNGVFVVVGDAGYAFYSSDGVAWTSINTGAGAKLKRVTYGNNLFVSVGEYGKIATSTDGTSWNKPASGVGSTHLNGVAYGNSKYVAVGDNGTIITSPDTVTWSAQTSGISVRLHSVCFNDGQFVAVGDSGTLLTSPNGVDWSTQVSGTSDLLVTVTFVNSRYMAVGNSGRVIYSDCGIPAGEPVITVTAPNGGESWEWDTQQTITWETSGGEVSNVKIEYSTDNGTNWTELAASEPNDGSFDWTIPDTFSDTCLIRVGDIDGTPSDVSDAVFSIATPAITPTLTVTAPNGGESFQVGSMQTITWSSEGYIENLKIEYSTDNGSTWTEIANTLSDSGSYDWVIPDLSTTQCLVRVADMDGDPDDASDAVFSIIPVPVDCGITWNTVDMSMHNLTGTLWDVVYADSQFLLVGSYGYVYSSTDGFNWTEQSPGTTKNLMSITYGNSLYMAAGSTGTLITSPDGVTWTARNLNTTYTLNDVTYGGATFMVVGDGGYAFYSSDGVTWTSKSTGAGAKLKRVTYGNNLFVAVGEYGKIATSTDGASWDKPTSGVGSTHLNGVAYGNSKYVAVGDSGTVITSPDAVTWSASASGTSVRLHSVCFNEGQFVAVGDSGTLLTSPNGVDWSTQVSGTTDLLITVTFVNSRYMAVGNSGRVIYSDCGIPASEPVITVTAPNGGESWEWDTQQTITWETSGGEVSNVKIEYSTDNGTNWTELAASESNDGSFDWTIPDTFSDTCLVRVGDIDGTPSDVSDAVFSIATPAVAPTLTVTAPNGGESFQTGSQQTITWSSEGYLESLKIEYSTDNGSTWTEIANTVSDSGSYDWVVPDLSSTQCLVRVADMDGDPDDASDTVFSIIPVPVDCGITWDTVDMSMHNLTGTLWDVVYADSQFLLVGSYGYMYSSTDGFNWTEQSPGTTKNLMGITYGNSLYMAAGATGTLITSPDGVTWTARNLNTTYTLNDVTYGGATFMVVGDGGYAFYSSDGVTWTSKNTSAGAKLKRVTYGNNLFVAVGEYGKIATSTDGTSWSRPASGVGSTHLNGVAYGNSRYVAVGDNGTVITSPDAVTWSTETSGTSVRLHSVCFNDGQFVAVGDSGTLLTSPNGVDWSTQVSVTTDLLITVEFVNSRYMAVGNSGRVIYSDCGIPASEPVITLTAPNGGESWEWDTQQTITWETSGGAVSNVKIEYSIDNGTNWTELAASTSNDGSFAWTIPDTFSDTCLVRVGDIDGTPSDVSDAVFSIATPAVTPTLTVTAPNGGESFEAGSQQTITWSSEGYIESLKIEYSTDNGSTWTEIANTVSDSGSYDWVTPDLSSTQCLVRVSDMDGDPTDTGDAVFSIIPVPVDCGITWNIVDMSMHNLTGTLWDIEYADSQFLLVGSYGYLYSSTDGFNWTKQSPGTTKNLMGITYGNSLYMAAGATGTLITSPDGVTWTAQNLNTTYVLNDVAFGNGVFIVVGDAGYAFYSSDGVSWTTINTSAGAKLKRINYVNNLFVAVGEYGRIATSTDGTSWDKPASGVGSTHLNGVAYGNSKYVAVGDNGTVITSPDAVTWSAETSGTSVRLHSVCFNNGQFVAVGDSGTLLTSPNGVDWSAQTSGTTDLLITVGFVNSRYMAMGNSGRLIYSDCGIPASDPVITVTSPNGGESWEWDTQQTITWETSGGLVSNVNIEYSVDSGTNWIELAASEPNDGSFDWTIPDNFSDNCLVRVSDIDNDPLDVSDAVFSIVTPSIAPTLTVTAPNGGESFQVGSQQNITWSSEGYIASLKIEYSTDNGSTWTEIANSVSDSGSYDWVIPDLSSNQCLIRISDMDSDPTDTGDAVFSIIPVPVDCGVTWNTVDMSGHNLTGTLWDVDYADSRFILVGSSGYLFSSTDGFNWTEQSSGTTRHLFGITYGNSLYMAAGSTGTLITSPDGVTWTTRNLNTTYTLSDVTYGGSTFMVVGDGGYAFYSSDGVTWTSKNTNAGAKLKRVTYGDNLFVAVGEYGKIATSTDGSSWSRPASGVGSTHLNGVAYGNSKYVAVGDNGTVITSPDAVTWSSGASGTSVRLHAVCFNDGQFIAVGDSGTVLTSPNGIDWSVQSSGTTELLIGISYVDYRFMAVGNSGTVIYSDCGINP